ncbi:MAG: AraC family transcriptional regulator [Marinobacterium sp.]|nr:AraC family transcriptional regulator [Marinobacterium sp.]
MTRNTTGAIPDLRVYQTEGDSHRHDWHQLILPVQGTLEVSTRSHEGVVSDCQGVLIEAHDLHTWTAQGDNCFLVLDLPLALTPVLSSIPAWFAVGPTLHEYLRFMAIVLRPSSQFPVLPGTTQSSGNADRQDLIAPRIAGEQSLQSLQQMTELLVQLLTEQYSKEARYDRRVILACQFIDTHLARPLTLAQVAAVVHLSPRQLSTLFRQALNCTPAQYQQQQRMRLAQRLLTQTQLSVQQIAERCGYNSLAAFSDRVKRDTGRSPRHWRTGSAVQGVIFPP